MKTGRLFFGWGRRRGMAGLGILSLSGVVAGTFCRLLSLGFRCRVFSSLVVSSAGTQPAGRAGTAGLRAGRLRPARLPRATGGCCGGVRCREAAGCDFGGAAELVVVAGGRCVRCREAAGRERVGRSEAARKRGGRTDGGKMPRQDAGERVPVPEDRLRRPVAIRD